MNNENNLAYTAWMSFKSNILNIAVISLIATLVFGVYPIYKEQYSNYKDLTIHYSALRPQLFSKENLDNIQISSNGKSVTGDVNMAYLTVWNNGDRPLVKSDIMKPIIINIPESKILSVKLKATNRHESRIECKKRDSSADKLILEWDFIEGGDAAVLQIIYEGPIADDILVDGIVLGQRDKKISYFNEKQVPNMKIKSLLLTILVHSIMFIALVLTALSTYKTERNIIEISNKIQTTLRPLDLVDTDQSVEDKGLLKRVCAMMHARRRTLTLLILVIMYILTAFIYPIYQYITSVGPPIDISALTK
jgi:hypothetical protein